MHHALAAAFLPVLKWFRLGAASIIASRDDLLYPLVVVEEEIHIVESIQTQYSQTICGN